MFAGYIYPDRFNLYRGPIYDPGLGGFILPPRIFVTGLAIPIYMHDHPLYQEREQPGNANDHN